MKNIMSKITWFIRYDLFHPIEYVNRKIYEKNHPEPRMFSLCKFVHMLPEGEKNQYPFNGRERLIYFGQIANAPGHSIVMDSQTCLFHAMYHTYHFVELTDEEL